MQPLFFGSNERHLYGVYHAPAVPGRRSAVLLCYPSVQEYMRAHWAFRRLAAMLSREGFAVLRFDYFGTGDSAGEYREANVETWCANILEAASELKDLADVSSLSVLGLEFGATLATLAVARGLAVQDLMLWEPASDGISHITTLRRLERLKYDMLRKGPRAEAHELLGYDFPANVASNIRAVTLEPLTHCAAQRISIYSARTRPNHAVLTERLRDQHNRPPEIHIVPEQAASGVEAVLLANRVLQAMTAALAGSQA